MKRSNSSAELVAVPPVPPSTRRSDERSPDEVAFDEMRRDPSSWFALISIADIEALVARRVAAPELWWFWRNKAECLRMSDNSRVELDLCDSLLLKSGWAPRAVRGHDGLVLLFTFQCDTKIHRYNQSIHRFSRVRNTLSLAADISTRTTSRPVVMRLPTSGDVFSCELLAEQMTPHVLPATAPTTWRKCSSVACVKYEESLTCALPDGLAHFTEASGGVAAHIYDALSDRWTAAAALTPEPSMHMNFVCTDDVVRLGRDPLVYGIGGVRLYDVRSGAWTMIRDGGRIFGDAFVLADDPYAVFFFEDTGERCFRLDMRTRRLFPIRAWNRSQAASVNNAVWCSDE